MIHYAASSFRDLIFPADNQCRTVKIGSNDLRSFFLRDLKRSTHFFEQKAVRQE
jgi:hypothetical protein